MQWQQHAPRLPAVQRTRAVTNRYQPALWLIPIDLIRDVIEPILNEFNQVIGEKGVSLEKDLVESSPLAADPALLQIVFAVRLGWLPLAGLFSEGADSLADMTDPASSDRPAARSIRPLRTLWPFIRPYGGTLAAALAALLIASLLLMWIAAILSAMIDNIPFTAAMVPIILGMEQQGINVAPLWWSLAIGVGMGGNGTHLGSTANVFIVTLSERLAKDTGDESLRITPGLWFRKGTPAMLLTLTSSSIVMWLFFGFFSKPL